MAEEPRWVKQSKRYESYNRPAIGEGLRCVTDFRRWAEKRIKPSKEPPKDGRIA